MRTIDGFIAEHASYKGRIYGQFVHKKDNRKAADWNFPDEDALLHFIKGLAKSEKDMYRYEGFKDEAKKEWWTTLEDLNEILY